LPRCNAAGPKPQHSWGFFDKNLLKEYYSYRNSSGGKLSASKYTPPPLLVFATVALAVCILFGILYVDVFKLTTPESTEKEVTEGKLVSYNLDSVNTRCATVYSIAPLRIAPKGNQVEQQLVEITFSDDIAHPVISESYYLFELNKAYRITIVKRPGGKLYLIDATYECGYRPPADNPSTRDYQIRPVPSPVPKRPVSYAGFFIYI
jgi:hypothetical protein